MAHKQQQQQEQGLGFDVLEKVMELLPAKLLAVAACVSTSWNAAARAVGQRPRVVSAMSLRANLRSAMEEVTAKVLEAPFRPQFAVVFAGQKFSLQQVSKLLQKALPKDISVIGCHAPGLIGVDVATNELKEVIWEFDEQAGLVLISGHLPGVHVEALSLSNMQSENDIDHFLARASSSIVQPPKAIILLSKPGSYIDDLLQKLDGKLGVGTTIVGGCCVDSNSKCLLAHCSSTSNCMEVATAYRQKCNEGTGGMSASGLSSKTPRRASSTRRLQRSTVSFEQDVVGLVFTEAKDGSSNPDFSHVSAGNRPKLCIEVGNAGALVPVGSIYAVASARVSKDAVTTRLACRREGSKAVVNHLEDLENHVANGVRACGKVSSPRKYLVDEISEKYIDVEGNGVKRGDLVQFYTVDRVAAIAEKELKLDDLKKRTLDKEILGSIMFVCQGRGEQLFGQPNADSKGFSERFPDVPMAGMFCSGEIGPSAVALNRNELQGSRFTPALRNSYSSMFTVFSLPL